MRKAITGTRSCRNQHPVTSGVFLSEHRSTGDFAETFHGGLFWLAIATSGNASRPTGDRKGELAFIRSMEAEIPIFRIVFSYAGRTPVRPL